MRTKETVELLAEFFTKGTELIDIEVRLLEIAGMPEEQLQLHEEELRAELKDNYELMRRHTYDQP